MFARPRPGLVRQAHKTLITILSGFEPSVVGRRLALPCKFISTVIDAGKDKFNKVVDRQIQDSTPPWTWTLMRGDSSGTRLISSESVICIHEMNSEKAHILMFTNKVKKSVQTEFTFSWQYLLVSRSIRNYAPLVSLPASFNGHPADVENVIAIPNYSQH